jgi:hypothetical protein
MTYYDPEVYKLTVYVTREANELKVRSTLAASTVISDGPVVFDNYTYNPTKITVKANKLFQGEKYDGSAFKFELLASDKKTVIETKEAKNGLVQFDYDKADEINNTFYIREVVGEDAAVVYDKTLYRAIVSFDRPENPSMEDKELKVKAYSYASVNEDGSVIKQVELPEFINKITPAIIRPFGTKLFNAQNYTGTEYTYQLKDTSADKSRPHV